MNRPIIDAFKCQSALISDMFACLSQYTQAKSDPLVPT